MKALSDGKRPTSPEYGAMVLGPCKEELIRLMKDCWHESPLNRPSADYTVEKLTEIQRRIASDPATQ